MNPPEEFEINYSNLNMLGKEVHLMDVINSKIMKYKKVTFKNRFIKKQLKEKTKKNDLFIFIKFYKLFF